MLGRSLDEHLLQEVADAVRARVDPTPDLHATAEYRRDIAGTLVARVVEKAAQRAAEGSLTRMEAAR